MKKSKKQRSRTRSGKAKSPNQIKAAPPSKQKQETSIRQEAIEQEAPKHKVPEQEAPVRQEAPKHKVPEQEAPVRQEAPIVPDPASISAGDTLPVSEDSSSAFPYLLRKSLVTIVGAALCLLIILYFNGRMSGKIPSDFLSADLARSGSTGEESAGQTDDAVQNTPGTESSVQAEDSSMEMQESNPVPANPERIEDRPGNTAANDTPHTEEERPEDPESEEAQQDQENEEYEEYEEYEDEGEYEGDGEYEEYEDDDEGEYEEYEDDDEDRPGYGIR